MRAIAPSFPRQSVAQRSWGECGGAWGAALRCDVGGGPRISCACVCVLHAVGSIGRCDRDGLAHMVNSLAARVMRADGTKRVRDDLFCAIVGGVCRMHDLLDRANGKHTYSLLPQFSIVFRHHLVDQSLLRCAHRFIDAGNACRHITMFGVEALLAEIWLLLDDAGIF